MIEPPSEPSLLEAVELAEADIGLFEWETKRNSDHLVVSNGGRSIEWGPRPSRSKGEYYPPAWVPATTLLHLHSGRYRWDYVVAEMACAQIGVGFMLLWDIGPDFGFFGYLGASSSAWSFDPSTGDVVCNTKSIQGGLPRFEDGHTGVVTVSFDLPRNAEGVAWFSIQGVASIPINLPKSSVILPAACFLKEGQKVTLANFQREWP